MPKKPVKTLQQLSAENADLRARLEEAEETLDAIRHGEVDALVVSGAGGDQVYTLRGADYAYRMLIEDMSEGALTLDTDGMILYANRAFAEMLQLPLENVIGSKFQKWVAEEHHPMLDALLAKDDKQKRRAEVILTGAGGSAVSAYLSLNTLNLEGEAAYFCLVATDLTEQKRHEEIAASERLARELLAAANQSRHALLSLIEDQKLADDALRENNEFLTNLLDNSPVSIYVNSVDGKISLVNRRWESNTGVPRAKAIGLALEQVYPPEIAEKFKADNQTVIKTGASQTFEEFIEPFHFYTVKFPLRDGRGQITAVGGISVDITPRKNAEMEAERSREQLHGLIDYLQTAIEDERAAIARELHDEFGQMMTGLKMDLSWLERHTEITEKQSQHIQSIHTLVDGAIATVRRISSELRPGLLDDLGLFPALEWLAGEYSRRADLECSIQLPPQEPELEPALRTTLFRIYQECMTNVIRHANATNVESSVRVEDGGLIMEVADNGRGMSVLELADPKSLGLMGMRERASKWNGSVQIHSAPDQGTKVLVRIPLPNMANAE